MFVPQDKQEEYLRKNNLYCEFLENGITILGAYRDTLDSVWAGMEIFFEFGACDDPKGKEGVHHFIEHFFNKPIRDKAHLEHVSLNAWTSVIQMAHTSSGVANREYKDYGLWKLIEPIITQLKNPLTNQDVESLLDAERRVVLTELHERNNSHDRMSNILLNKALYSPDNPLNKDILGNEESLKNITLEDMQQIITTHFVPQNIVAVIKTDADKKTLLALIERIKREFARYEKRGKRWEFTFENLDKTNTLSPGSAAYIPTGNKNNLVSIFYVWPLDLVDFTVETSAAEMLSDEVYKQVFEYSRKRGWSYTFDCFLVKGDMRGMFFVIRLDVKTDDRTFYQKTIKEIQEYLPKLVSFSQDHLKKVVANEHKRQEATPMPFAAKLRFLKNSLRRFQKMMDGEQVRQLYLQVTHRHLKERIEYLSSQKPAVFEIGHKE